MTKRWLGLAAAMVGVLGGCSVEVTVDDVLDLNGDFQLSGAWTLNGAAPTTATCAEAGISTVRLIARSRPAGELGIPLDGVGVDPLVFPCADGGFTFPEAAEEALLLDYGTYGFEWQALDGTGTVVANLTLDPLTVSAPTTSAAVATFALEYDVPQGDFSLAGSWTIDGQPADATSCAALGIDTVAVVTTDGTSSAAEVDFVFNCEDGSFHDTMNLLPYGSYILRWEARSASGDVLASQMNPTLVVNAPLTMATIAPFAIAIPSSFLVNLSYAGELCEMSDVARIRYRFFRQTAEGVYTGGTDIVNELGGTGLGCTNSLFFGPPAQTLTAGFYTLFVEAYDSSDVKLMEATEQDMPLDAGEMVFYNVSLSGSR